MLFVKYIIVDCNLYNNCHILAYILYILGLRGW